MPAEVVSRRGQTPSSHNIFRQTPLHTDLTAPTNKGLRGYEVWQSGKRPPDVEPACKGLQGYNGKAGAGNNYLIARFNNGLEGRAISRISRRTDKPPADFVNSAGGLLWRRFGTNQILQTDQSVATSVPCAGIDSGSSSVSSTPL